MLPGSTFVGSIFEGVDRVLTYMGICTSMHKSRYYSKRFALYPLKANAWRFAAIPLNSSALRFAILPSIGQRSARCFYIPFGSRPALL